jgi:hypothetical protein
MTEAQRAILQSLPATLTTAETQATWTSGYKLRKWAKDQGRDRVTEAKLIHDGWQHWKEPVQRQAGKTYREVPLYVPHQDWYEWSNGRVTADFKGMVDIRNPIGRQGKATG